MYVNVVVYFVQTCARARRRINDLRFIFGFDEKLPHMHSREEASQEGGGGYYCMYVYMYRPKCTVEREVAVFGGPTAPSAFLCANHVPHVRII